MKQFDSASFCCITAFSLFAAGCTPARAPQSKVESTATIVSKQPPELQAAGISAEPYKERLLPLNGRPEVTLFSALPAGNNFDPAKHIGFVDLSGFGMLNDGLPVLPLGGHLTLEVDFADGNYPDQVSLLYFAMETVAPNHKGEKIAFVEVSVRPDVSPFPRYGDPPPRVNTWEIKGSWLEGPQTIATDISDEWNFMIPSLAMAPLWFKADLNPLGTYLTVRVDQIFREKPPTKFGEWEKWNKRTSGRYFRVTIRSSKTQDRELRPRPKPLRKLPPTPFSGQNE